MILNFSNLAAAKVGFGYISDDNADYVSYKHFTNNLSFIARYAIGMIVTFVLLRLVSSESDDNRKIVKMFLEPILIVSIVFEILTFAFVMASNVIKGLEGVAAIKFVLVIEASLSCCMLYLLYTAQWDIVKWLFVAQIIITCVVDLSHVMFWVVVLCACRMP